jgi:hypothetical protein
LSERQADEKPSQAVEKPAPPVSTQIVKRTKDLSPNEIRMQKQLTDTHDRLSRLESWRAAVGRLPERIGKRLSMGKTIWIVRPATA